MKTRWKRAMASVLAASMLLSTYTAVPAANAAEKTFAPGTYEAEDLTLTGAQVLSSSASYFNSNGFSGSGYVQFSDGNITMNVDVEEAGMYEISSRLVQLARGGAMNGVRCYIEVNGKEYDHFVPYADSWTDASFGYYYLDKGVNTILLSGVRNYIRCDTMTVEKTALPTLTGDSTTSDPDATEETKRLMEYLSSVYGKHILAGQRSNYNGKETEFEYLYGLTGEYPALRSWFESGFNPNVNGAVRYDLSEQVIDWVNERNGIAYIELYPQVPIDFESYDPDAEMTWPEMTGGTDTTFDVAKATTKGTKENAYLDSMLALIAEFLLELQAKDVPVVLDIFSYQDANGGMSPTSIFYWWSMGGPEAYRDLWQYVHTEMRETYGVHNVIWSNTMHVFTPDTSKWCVGNDYVDILGISEIVADYLTYPDHDPYTNQFYDLYEYSGGDTMLALNRNDSVPPLDGLVNEKAGWLWFDTDQDWEGSMHASGETFQDPDVLKELYQSDYCITLDELPLDLYGEPRLPGDVNADGVLTAEDPYILIRFIKRIEGDYPIIVVYNGDFDNDDDVDVVDYLLLVKELVAMGEILPGDINCDNVLDAKDLALYDSYLAGTAGTLTPQAEMNADYDGGGVIDSYDRWLLEEALGLTTDPTEPSTEKPTEAPTEPPTEKPTEAPTEPPTNAVKGDANGDGELTAKDPYVLLNYIRYNECDDPVSLWNGDYDGNGKINIIDYLQIVKALVEMGKVLPGDINCDNTLDSRDITIYDSYLSGKVKALSPQAVINADYNADSVIDESDRDKLAKELGITTDPTEDPTEAPTEPPTEKPTEAPTEPPTEKPTEAPTEPPTEKPTEAPTEPPTEKPTEAPTEPPTEKPTEAPIEPPTEAPTQAPTAPFEFTWGEDNWNFNNSAVDGSFPSLTFKEMMLDEHIRLLSSRLTNSEYFSIFIGSKFYPAWITGKWGGSCYGMTATALLSSNGLFPYDDYLAGADCLNDLPCPADDMEISSLISYYQMLQIKDVIQNHYRKVKNQSHKTNITNLLKALDTYPTVMVGYRKDGWGGHAVLAYDYSYGSWSYSGRSFDGCIYVCDPNRSTGYNVKYNIYFNSTTYDWYIPAYAHYGVNAEAGAVFNYIGGNVNEINKGGLLTGATGIPAIAYVARIDAVAIAENHMVEKVSPTAGNVYLTQNCAPGEIEADYSYVMVGASEGVFGYNLADNDAAYRITQTDAEPLQLTMDYGSSTMYAGNDAGNEIVFDNEGTVTVSGTADGCLAGMVWDSNYTTSWFAMEAHGRTAESMTLEMTDSGYLLSADSLENVKVTASNRETTASVTFSTDATEVLLYQIDETTIGVAIDTDGNGTFETKLVDGTETVTGDVNEDGGVTILDVIGLSKALMGCETLTEQSALNADVDADTVPTSTDALVIMKYLVKIVDKL